MELNGEQIIKALGCCYMQELEHGENCPECPYTDLYPKCVEYLGKHAFSLIKELTEENEEQEKAILNILRGVKIVRQETKADTVRKMQARLLYEWDWCAYDADEAPDVINRVAKELLEDAE